ncbi:hypothetical protein ACH0CA_12070 [Kytococcus sedentarius]|uniref:hypothetical protein n=1 Tax=Kytococcus sedentarius TaxID=1276 RepID=UPI00387954AA
MAPRSGFATTLMALAEASADRPPASPPVIAIHHDGEHLELVRPGEPAVRLRCAADREAAQEEIRAQLGWTWAGTDLAALGDVAPWSHGLGWEVYLHDIGRYWFLVEDLREERGEAVRAEALWQDGDRFCVRLRSSHGTTTESRPLNGLDFTGALGLEMALDHLRRVSHPGTDQA